MIDWWQVLVNMIPFEDKIKLYVCICCFEQMVFVIWLYINKTELCCRMFSLETLVPHMTKQSRH